MAFDKDLEHVVRMVPGWDQVAAGKYVFLEGNPGGSPRILFLGNSITWHGPKAEIGWNGSWGMAASCREKDYVHLLISKIRDLHPDAGFCITQGAIWERNIDSCDLAANFAAARDFTPDIVYVALGANTPSENFDGALFQRCMQTLLNFIAEKSAQPKFIIATNYWNDPKTQALREFAMENGYPLVDLSDSLAPEENRAIGQFSHEGVANHPGDLGMQRIAERIWRVLEPLL
ncbi:MAG: SGNH/GDSL hydrolase family protein [Eubacteriales bacterium]|nr:SGNH/GDSL hydrolase family protein [Eubacteriales bacterium]